MACNTGRCALRRFDGHGSGSYRPSNSGLASENEKKLAEILALRKEMDKTYGPNFGVPEGVLVKPWPEFNNKKEEIGYLADNLWFAGTIKNPETDQTVSSALGLTPETGLKPETSQSSSGLLGLKPETSQKPDNFTTWKTPSASNWKSK